MKTTHHVCDRCEADISGGPRSHLRPTAGAACDQWPEGLDLCSDCLMALLAWLDGEPAAVIAKSGGHPSIER